MGHCIDEVSNIIEDHKVLGCSLMKETLMSEIAKGTTENIENNNEICNEEHEDKGITNSVTDNDPVGGSSNNLVENNTNECAPKASFRQDDPGSCDENKNPQEQLTAYDSDEESINGSNKSNKENFLGADNKKKKAHKSSGLRKISKNQIKEERLKIQSETHRLMREREISVPYHIPKQRTLKEFLARKKNHANVPLNMPKSKMLEIWKDIEESTKHAFEFFKSDGESDSEVEEKDKSNLEVGISSNLLSSCRDEPSTANTINVNNGNNRWENDHENQGSDFVEDNECTKIKVNKEETLVDVPEVRVESENKFKESHYDKNEVVVKQMEDSILDPSKSTENCADFNDHQGSKTDANAVDSNLSDEEYARERTSDWVKGIQVFEKMFRQDKKKMLLEKLNPKLLNITPKLSGDTNSFVDLENVKNSMELGAKNLKKRFLEHIVAPKQKRTNKEVELTIISKETNANGAINKISSDKLFYNSPEIVPDPILEKPGAKLQRLREELKKKIEEKWEEEYKKKNTEKIVEVNNKEKEGFEEEAVEEDLIEDVERVSEESLEIKLRNEDVRDKKRRKNNEFIESEAEESECEDEESGNEGGDELDDHDFVDFDGEDDNDEEQSEHSQEFDSQLIPPYQPGGGIVNEGSELTQNDDESPLPKDILDPVVRLSLDLSPPNKDSNYPASQTWDMDLGSPEETNAKKNFVPCFPETANFDLSDAYEFCSGKFPDEADSRSQECRIGETFSQGFNSLEDSESGALSDKVVFTFKDDCEVEGGEKPAKNRRTRIQVVSDDSEEETNPVMDNFDEDENITAIRIDSDDSDNDLDKGKPDLGKKRTRKQLQFSDEEEESSAEELESDLGNNEEQDDESSREGDLEREAEYDSEEVEILNPTDFFDKEAELSGSEWSGDEDEKDLDKFEMEDGDNDNLDGNEVRSQLEKIHMRRLLDDDERDVRILQELLFEDGDLFDDGPRRERNFRWKDLGAFFAEEDEGKEGQNGVPQEEQDEDEESRKARHEKELFLMRLKSKREDSDEEEGKSLLKLGKVVLERSRKVTTVSSRKVVESVTHDVDENLVKIPFGPTNQRGSFLSRNEEFLSRLAKFTSSATENILGPKNSKNFVFVAKSPEKGNHSSKENSHPKRKNPSPRGDVKNKKTKLDLSMADSRSSVLDRLT